MCARTSRGGDSNAEKDRGPGAKKEAREEEEEDSEKEEAVTAKPRRAESAENRKGVATPKPRTCALSI